jgi:hypothetical protein
LRQDILLSVGMKNKQEGLLAQWRRERSR